MLSVSNLLCRHEAGNERLRYGHTHKDAAGRAAKAAPGDAAPRPVVVWNITQACNLRCVHCYASALPGPAPGELTHAEGRALLEDVKAFNVPAVLFSGGEPLSRPDCLDLIAYARELGLNTTLSTNGILIDDKTADRLAELEMRYIGISLDGTEARHDKLRGLEGAYTQTLAAIDRCRKRGLKVGLRFTVHALNEMDMEAVFETCLEHDIQRLCVYHLASAGRGRGMKPVTLTAKQTRNVVDRIFATTRRYHKEGRPLEVLTVGNHTDAAYVLMHLAQEDSKLAAETRDRLRGTGGNRSGCNISCVDPQGNVHYDQFSWHYTCGNVREKPFSRIWAEATDPRLAILRDRREFLPPKCKSCHFLDICNGNLRTRAESASGNWLGDDPSCYLTDEEVRTGVLQQATSNTAAD